MNNHNQYIDLIRSLPPLLKNDPEMFALAQVIAKQLQGTIHQINQDIIYARIDELGEQILDVLAYDMHIDWYDDTAPIKDKRETIRVHKHLGTKYAVETALGAIYPGTKVSEWFEYDGKPFRFRLHINTTGIHDNLERQKRALNTLNYCKNVRSHLDVIYCAATRCCV